MSPGTGEALIYAYVQRDADPWNKSLSRNLKAGAEWRELFLPFTMDGTYAADTVAVVFGLGRQAQTLEIGELEVLD